MSGSLHSWLSSLAKDPAASLQEISGYVADVAGKKPLEVLIDYHNFWARTMGMEAMVVDRDQDIAMDKLAELFNQVAKEVKTINIAGVWEAMVARGQTVTVTEIMF